MLSPQTATVLVAPLMLLAVWLGLRQLRRAWARGGLLVEELALAGAWGFVVGGLVWLRAYLCGESLLGFASPWTGLTAVHFITAGFGAWTLTALCCRVVTAAWALRLLRVLVCLHPACYFVVAAGINGVEYCDEIGASCYLLIFVLQLAAVWLGRPARIAVGPRRLLLMALLVPLFSMVPALAWAFGRPFFSLGEMALYHGLGNALGHVGLGLVACARGAAKSHAPAGR